MTVDPLFSMLVAQSVQLLVPVGLVSAIALRRRPHLAYALWMVVLDKAVTPPV